MTRRWAVLSGLVAALLAVVLVLFLGTPRSSEGDAPQAADGTTADATPARCEEHGLTRPDPRADPDPVSNAADEPADSVQLDREFTSGATTSQYHLFTRGVDFDQPVGVVVRLHGDGTNEYENPDGLLNCLAAVAASHNMVLVAPLTPDVEGEITWWEDISTNLPWLIDLLDQRVLEPYAPDPDNVWWMGYSGGAEMITYGVIPRNPQYVTGGALMIGGGGAPEALVEEPTSEQRESLDLLWVTGTLDDGTDPWAPFDAVTATREGSSWYRQQGFEGVRADYPEGEDHFSLRQARILDETLRQPVLPDLLK
ncbi:hypothetical protein [Nesterenkonia sp. CF4.4]|uniref:hypothetical protein n=1 Tax=Nesterenkonia sp. CF4.4 TaxID=3373079 RepID=UPI003EE50A74